MSGLSEREAALRLQRDGPNELPSAQPRSVFRIALDVVREPMFLLLIVSGAVYLLLGDLAEALALLIAVFAVIGITLFQEQRTERALQSLKDLSSPRALVIRDGVARRIAGRDVVRDDVIVLREGDRVAADAVVLSCRNLSADESLLTGESVPVRKAADVPVYSGTLIVSGEGTGRVVETGLATELGKIGAALGRVRVERTRLQTEVNRAVRVLAVLGIGACVIVAIAHRLAGHRWLDGALAGLTLAISMVPEEFPAILTIFLALGAWRISRSHVLTRRIPAVETLGSATVLCVDKTGTLTMNHMSVAALSAVDHSRQTLDDARPLSAASRHIVSTAILASKPDAFDPMERAFHDLGKRLDIDPPSEHVELVREYPLADDLLAVTHVWQNAGDGRYLITAKGAPEAIAELCRLDEPARRSLLQDTERMANDGLRVLGVASGEWASADLPPSPREFSLEYLGLAGLADPVRPGVPAAIAECRSAHIRVVMITGDYPATALNIARQIGLARSTSCLTGSQIAGMDASALQARVRDVDVFARITPDQKLRLVTAFKAGGEVVGMTGDGVNDAPALKAADIGIAMGNRGTDVAREAAGLVLLDDDFTSILRAVRLGRRIYDNIEKATAYVLGIHVPIAGISLIPVFFGWPLVLMPVHVIFIELVSDPACSVAFEMEPEEIDIMRRPPRNPRKKLFTRTMIARSLLQGAGSLAAALVIFIAGLEMGLKESDVRMLTFSALIVTNLALIMTNRSLTRPAWAGWRVKNPAIRWLAVATAVALATILFVPKVGDLFRMSRPHLDDAAVVAVIGVAAFLWMEAAKWAVNAVSR